MRLKTKIKIFLNRSENIFIKCFRFILFKINKVIIYPFYFIAKIIDVIFIPIAIFYEKKGINVFEAKTRSFGHHLFEPVAVAVLNLSKEKIHQKKLILLANQEKAYVKYTNTFLKQHFKIIDNYSFLNLYYWLARSKFCGISRATKYKDQLDIFFETHFKYRYKLNIFNNDELVNDYEIKSLFKSFNPENRFVVVWKPKCHRDDKFSSYSPLRYSSLDSCKPLFDKIHNEGGIVFGLLYGKAKFTHNAVVDLRKIKNNLLRERFVFYLDFICKYGITGQNGGSVLLHIYNKPLIVYDVSYPYTINFLGLKTIVSLKKAIYRDGSPVRIETLLNINNIEKIVKDQKMIFENNSSEDLIKLYEELKMKLRNNPESFEENDFRINREWGDLIPRNSFNTFGYSQIADYCYEKQYPALAPKNFLRRI